MKLKAVKVVALLVLAIVGVGATYRLGISPLWSVIATAPVAGWIGYHFEDGPSIRGQ